MQTPEEVLVMRQLLEWGWSRRPISVELGISPNTLERYLARGHFSPCSSSSLPPAGWTSGVVAAGRSAGRTGTPRSDPAADDPAPAGACRASRESSSAHSWPWTASSTCPVSAIGIRHRYSSPVGRWLATRIFAALPASWRTCAEGERIAPSPCYRRSRGWKRGKGPFQAPTDHLGDKADLTPSPLQGQAATGAA
jgi:hypothetical protein